MRTFITTEQKQISQIRERIIGRRKALGITQQDMADEIGKARNTYSDIERDLGKAHLEDFLLIIRKLELESDMLDIVQRK